MLVSHCGEYMANGMIANDCQTFVAVRKHSRSFLWCLEVIKSYNNFYFELEKPVQSDNI